MILAIVFFLFGFFVSILATPWVIAFSRQRSIGLDDPNANRKRHTEPISRLGGVPIVVALSLGLVGILIEKGTGALNWKPVLVGSLLMFGLGFLDDLRPLGAKKKFFGQILIASLVYHFGLNIVRVTYPGGGWNVEL